MRIARIAHWAAGCVAATLLSLFPATAASPPSEQAKAELAPGGTLRVGLFRTNPNYVIQGLPEGQWEGVAVDIARALADRLGATFEPVAYRTVDEILAGRGSAWNVAFMGIEAGRLEILDFSPAYMHTENSYIVPSGSGLMTIADVDRAGVKVGAQGRTVQQNFLKTALKQATLVEIRSVSDGVGQELGAGKLDAVAGGRDQLETLAQKMPGHRVLPGTFYSVRLGMATPKGRSAGAAYVAEFIREMKASGAVARAIERAKLRGATVPRD